VSISQIQYRNISEGGQVQMVFGVLKWWFFQMKENNTENLRFGGKIGGKMTFEGV
jgi:hypothetical protein